MSPQRDLGLAMFRHSTFNRSCQLLSCASSALSKLAPPEPKHLHIVAELVFDMTSAHVRACTECARRRRARAAMRSRFRPCMHGSPCDAAE